MIDPESCWANIIGLSQCQMILLSESPTPSMAEVGNTTGGSAGNLDVEEAQKPGEAPLHPPLPRALFSELPPPISLASGSAGSGPCLTEYLTLKTRLRSRDAPFPQKRLASLCPSSFPDILNPWGLPIRIGYDARPPDPGKNPVPRLTHSKPQCHPPLGVLGNGGFYALQGSWPALGLVMNPVRLMAECLGRVVSSSGVAFDHKLVTVIYGRVGGLLAAFGLALFLFGELRILTWTKTLSLGVLNEENKSTTGFTPCFGHNNSLSCHRFHCCNHFDLIDTGTVRSS
ncbi:hypothetical protein VTI74DRAFT_5141 [Chaetomium olivicolor]